MQGHRPDAQPHRVPEGLRREQVAEDRALLGGLRESNNALQKSDGPYFGGEDVNAADLRVAPQLKHVIIGTKSLKVCTQSY